MSYPLKEERDIQLREQMVRYTLVRRKRRSIGFKVDEAGLTVSAPHREPYYYLEQLIQERAPWILGKLQEMAAKRLPPHTWQHGARLLLLGEELELQLYRSLRRAEPIRSPGKLWLGLPDPQDADNVQTRIHHWYRRMALHHFHERLAHYSPRLGLPVPQLKLSNAKTTWGMCLSSGVIRLSWRLIKAPQPQIDYVVAHEVSHLRHMNHSPAFWKTVESLFPDFREQRKALERDGARYHTF